MHVVFDPVQRLHTPDSRLFAGKLMQCPEQPSRADRLLAAACDFGCRMRTPAEFGIGPISAVHDAGYLAFLQTAHCQWTALDNASNEVFPHVYGVRHVRGRPTSVLGLAGLYMAGTNCPIGAGTWRAAYASAQAAIDAAKLVCGGENAAYALCRPPGHHAYADLAAGFCYLNNAAIAVNVLRASFSRIAVVDIDVHHGNGTQEIFYRRNDVYFVSVHADPANFFPFYAGYAGERGADEGLGFNLNLPMMPGSGDLEVAAAVDRGLAELGAFNPQALVVSLGFDAAATDPLGVFGVTVRGFEDIGRALGELGVPTVLVQEGGYDSECLAQNLIAFLTGFTGQRQRHRESTDRTA